MNKVALTEREGTTMISFPASYLGLAAVPKGGGDYRPLKLAEAMLGEGVLAALDGPMFSNCGGVSYARSLCADPYFAQIDLSVGISELADREHVGKGVSLSVVRNAAVWTRGNTVAPGASVSIQLYPGLVVDGQASQVSVTGGNAEHVWRAGVVGLPTGDVGFVVAVDSLAGFARRCAALGAIWGGYTDGGGSTALGMRGTGGAVRRWGSREDRPVAAFLVAREAPFSPVSILGSSLLVGGVVALGSLAFFEARRRWSIADPKTRLFA